MLASHYPYVIIFLGILRSPTTINYWLQAMVTIDVVYSCLGLGVMSFFSAFVIAYPKKLKPKLIFLASGILCIQLLNVIRFVLLALLWDKKSGMILDHHTIFNITIYLIIGISLYFWVKHDAIQPIAGAKN